MCDVWPAKKFCGPVLMNAGCWRWRTLIDPAVVRQQDTLTDYSKFKNRRSKINYTVSQYENKEFQTVNEHCIDCLVYSMFTRCVQQQKPSLHAHRMQISPLVEM